MEVVLICSVLISIFVIFFKIQTKIDQKEIENHKQFNQRWNFLDKKYAR